MTIPIPPIPRLLMRLLLLAPRPPFLQDRLSGDLVAKQDLNRWPLRRGGDGRPYALRLRSVAGKKRGRRDALGLDDFLVLEVPERQTHGLLTGRERQLLGIVG